MQRLVTLMSTLYTSRLLVLRKIGAKETISVLCSRHSIPTKSDIPEITAQTKVVGLHTHKMTLGHKPGHKDSFFAPKRISVLSIIAGNGIQGAKVHILQPVWSSKCSREGRILSCIRGAKTT